MSPTPPADSSRPLTDFERSILDFELTWSSARGSKREAVQERFGMPLATYYRRRAAVVALDEAAAYAPALVRRLR